VDAHVGGRIDLRGMRQHSGLAYVNCLNPGSLVDLSGLTGVWQGNGSVVKASDGGAILISNVTAMQNLTLELRDDAAVPTTQLRSITGGYITLNSRTNGFEGLTNFTGTFYVSDTRLDLTNWTTLYATNNSPTFQALQGSVIDLSRLTNVVTMNSGYGLQAFAYGGSRIDLSRLRVPEGYFYAQASGAASLIDLSGLSGVCRNGSLSADNGATLLIPNLTAFEGGAVNVSGNASMNLAQIGSFTDGYLTLTGRTNDFLGLTNFAGTTISVSDSLLILTNVTTLYTTNNYRTITANQGSVIDLSRVTNWVSSGWELDVYAYNGSRIDLRRLPAPQWRFKVDAQGAGSLIDLSGFTGVWNAESGEVRAAYGATVLIPNVTATRNVNFFLRNDAIVPMAQLHSFTGGSIELSIQTNVFSGLTNFDGYCTCTYGRAEFSSLTRLSTANNYPISFRANEDSVIDLIQVTNPVVGSSSLSLVSYHGGRIDMPGVESIAASTVTVLAEGAGSVVDLTRLTSFFCDNNSGSLRTSSGGTILLNTNAMLLAGIAIDLQSNPGDVLPSFLAPSQALVLYGRPWQSYRVESRNPADGSPWSLYARVPLTSPLQILGPRPPDSRRSA